MSPSSKFWETSLTRGRLHINSDDDISEKAVWCQPICKKLTHNYDILGHLGADLGILGCRKCFRGGHIPPKKRKKKFFFFFRRLYVSLGVFWGDFGRNFRPKSPTSPPNVSPDINGTMVFSQRLLHHSTKRCHWIVIQFELRIHVIFVG